MIEIKKDSLNLNITALSIRVVPNGFCFAISDTTSKELIYFAQYNLSADETKAKGWLNITTKNALLNNHFEESFLLIDSEQYFLIPTSIFEANDLSQYWQLHFNTIGENETIRYDIIPTTGIVVVYSVDTELEKCICQNFPTIQTKHRQSIQILSSLKKAKKSGQHLNIFLYEESFDVVLTENGSPILANSYPAKNTNEFLYFLLNLFEQFKLDQYHTELIINNSSTNLIWVEEIKKYIHCIHINQEPLCSTDKMFLQSTECIQQISLLNLPLCV